MRNVVVTILGVVLVLGIAGVDRAGDRVLSREDLPAATLKDFETRWPGAKVREYSVEDDEGKPVYEIAFVVDGRNIDASYSDRGALLEVEETVGVEALPKKAITSIETQFKNYEIRKVEKVTKGNDSFFEVTIVLEIAGERAEEELLFTPEGAALKKVPDEEDDDEGESESDG